MSARVSTIIPAYNAERTIAQAIDSVLSQDFKGHEVVVVNDGSTDSTAAIVQKYGSRIGVITQRNRGPSAARNAGVRGSTGKYLAFLDGDDIWQPGKLETMVSAMEQNPLASLAFSEYGKIDEKGADCGASSIGHTPSMEEMLTQRFLPILPSTWVIPREIFERTGGFSESFKGAGLEDPWMLLLLRELGQFVYVRENLTLYRVPDSGKTADRYGPGLPIFISLVKERYGARGKALICDAKNRQCRGLLSKVAYQMNNGDRLGAVRTIARAVRFRPGFFLTSEFRGRLFLPHNMRRVRDLIALLNRAHD